MPKGIGEYAVIDRSLQYVPRTLRCTGESWAYHRDRSCTAYSPIPFGNQNRLGDIEYLCQDICGRAAAFAGLWLKFRCTGESWAYLHDKSSTAYSPIPFGNQNRLGDIEYLCRNVRHGLTYSWQNGSLCWHIIEGLAHRRSASQRVRKLRHGSGILGSNSPFHCRGFPGL